MPNTYAVIGAGMQGTAAAYDLLRFDPGCTVKLLDISLTAAVDCAARLEKLHPGGSVISLKADATHVPELTLALKGVDVALSCLPYYMHTGVAQACLAAGCNMTDLGGNMDVTLATLKLDEQAKKVGITLVPDCGLAPGLVNNLASWLIEEIPSIESIKLFCGVLPQNPKPPLNYMLLFNIEGLTNEYDHSSLVLRGGELAEIPTLTELEHQDFAAVGTLEAFVTSGGTSTAPMTHKRRVPNYEYKTLRYPGHCAYLNMFRDLGFWSTTSVALKQGEAVPREMFNAVLESSLRTQEPDHDQCFVRAIGEGGGKRIQLDIHDHFDSATGFTSMERLTGFAMSIYAIEIASRRVVKGAIPYELAVPGKVMIDALALRGIAVTAS